jgi:hypothetical protein
LGESSRERGEAGQGCCDQSETDPLGGCTEEDCGGTEGEMGTGERSKEEGSSVLIGSIPH